MSGELKKLLVLGTRPYAAVFTDVLNECPGWRVVGFVENEDRARCAERMEGLPIHWVDDIGRMAGDHWAICSLGTTMRDRFVEQVAGLGMKFATAVHKTAHVSSRSELGEGVCLDVGVIVAGYTSIGRYVRINRGVTVGHHARIEDFCTIQPGANVAGNTRIGRQTYIGMGANVLDGITIGEHCVVGAGAVVTKDLPDRVMVMGVPAKVVKENIEGK